MTEPRGVAAQRFRAAHHLRLAYWHLRDAVDAATRMKNWKACEALTDMQEKIGDAAALMDLPADWNAKRRNNKN